MLFCGKKVVYLVVLVLLQICKPGSTQFCATDGMILYDTTPQGFDTIRIEPNCPPNGINVFRTSSVLWTIESTTQTEASISSLPAEFMTAELVGSELTFQYKAGNTSVPERVGIWVQVPSDQLKTVNVVGVSHRVQILPGFSKLNFIQVNGVSNSVRATVEADSTLVNVEGNSNRIVIEDSSATGITLDVEGIASSIDVNGLVKSGEVEGANYQIRIQGRILEQLEMIGVGGSVVVNETCSTVKFDSTFTTCTVDSNLEISADPMECTIEGEEITCNRDDTIPSSGRVNSITTSLLCSLFLVTHMF